MSFSRRMRRQGQKAPSAEQMKADLGATEAYMKRALDAVKAAVPPGIGFVLLTVPEGIPTEEMHSHVACGMNIERDQAASLFAGMIDYWGAAADVTQPDPRTVQILRSMVHAIRGEPVAKLAESLAKSAANLGRAMAHLEPDGILTAALMVATEALAIYDRAVSEMTISMPADVAAEIEHAMAADPRERGDTKTTLVADLEGKPPCENRDQIIAMARRGVFHDYDSEVAAPKMMLVEMLEKFGYPDLAAKTRAGAYDGDRPSLEQIEEMRQQLGPEMYDAMIGGKKRPVS